MPPRKAESSRSKNRSSYLSGPSLGREKARGAITRCRLDNNNKPAGIKWLNSVKIFEQGFGPAHFFVRMHRTVEASQISARRDGEPDPNATRFAARSARPR